MPKTESNTAAEKEQPQALQTMTYVPQYAQPFEDDTIDLYELWITLWSKKRLVIGVTVIAALGSVVFALLQPPIYKAEALLLPPDENKFQSLNVQGVPGMEGVRGLQGVQGITSNGVFKKFNKNLSSRILQKKFIQDFGLMELLAPERTPETRDEDIYKDFSEMFKIETKGSTSISIELHDPEVAVQWVNDYVKFMDKETISMLIEKIQNSIGDQIRDIEYMISSKRELAKIRREDKITGIENTIAAKRELVKQRRLDKITGIENTIAAKKEGAKQRRLDQILRFKEAILIADSLGIKKREDATSFIKSTQMNLDIITSTNPLYYAGSKELQAEINTLEQRKSDDPFISGLRDLQEELAQLNAIKSDDPYIPGLRDLQENLVLLNGIKSDDPFISGLRDLQENLALLRQIKIEDEGLHAVTIDQAAYPPKNRIKPNRRLIVSLGTVVGLFLGIFLVFFVSFIQKQKEAHSA
ncbi:Wzz/FepE/Etk N-terminal domain-containing protein [Deltaproteobacteria bacterium]|nr:Wzz/FepE/Etk N-terminal domain-containing protein [Deltaproteobacteria bacterium]